eukprot:jgi/Chlat1/763/Chrsp104S01238
MTRAAVAPSISLALLLCLSLYASHCAAALPLQRRRLLQSDSSSVTVAAFYDPPFINLLPTDLAGTTDNGQTGIVASADLRDHALAMPKFGYALALFDLVALRSNMPYLFNMTGQGMSDVCQYVGETTSDLRVALVPLPRLADVDYVNPCDHDLDLKRIPMYESGMVMMVRLASFEETQTSPGAAFLHALKQPSSINAMCVFVIGIILSGHVMWMLERNSNSETFPKPYLEGLDDSCWWSAQTVTTVGYGDKVPITLLGRVFAFVWAVAGLFIIVFFTGTITSEMTLSRKGAELQGLADITSGTNVGVMSNWMDATSAVIGGIGANLIACGSGNDITSCADMLKKKQVQVVIGDYPTVVNFVSNTVGNNGEYDIIGDVFNEGNVYDYNIVVNVNAPGGADLYDKLLSTLESVEGGGSYDRITSHYFGDARRKALAAQRTSTVLSLSSRENSYNWWLIVITLSVFLFFILLNIYTWAREAQRTGEIHLPRLGRWILRRLDTFHGRKWVLEPVPENIPLESARSRLRGPSDPDSCAPNGQIVNSAPSHTLL